MQRLLWRGLTRACPVCGRRAGLTRRWIHLVERCPRCGLGFERIEGHWIGAVGVNTIVTFGTVLITVVAGFLLTGGQPDPLALAGIALAVAVVLPIVFYPVSKTLWTAIDLAMRPLQPGELEATIPPPRSADH